jgi:hypothetical protein
MLQEITLYGATVASISQLISRMRSMVMFLTRIVAARFMQRDGKADITVSNTLLLCGVFFTVTRATEKLSFI